MWARKKIPKICGRDFLAYTREKKSTRFVGEIFTRFSSLSPRKKNLQDLWDYFLGSKINKICGPHILLIFFLQEKWIYPQDSHVSCPRNSNISLEELYRDRSALQKFNSVKWLSHAQSESSCRSWEDIFPPCQCCMSSRWYFQIFNLNKKGNHRWTFCSLPWTQMTGAIWWSPSLPVTGRPCRCCYLGICCLPVEIT